MHSYSACFPSPLLRRRTRNYQHIPKQDRAWEYVRKSLPFEKRSSGVQVYSLSKVTNCHRRKTWRGFLISKLNEAPSLWTSLELSRQASCWLQVGHLECLLWKVMVLRTCKRRGCASLSCCWETKEGISWSKGVDSVLWLMVRLVEKTWGCQVIPTH